MQMLQGKKRNNESKSFPKQKETYFFCSHYFAICGEGRGRKLLQSLFPLRPLFLLPPPLPLTYHTATHNPCFPSRRKNRSRGEQTNKQNKPFFESNEGRRLQLLCRSKGEKKSDDGEEKASFLLFEIAMCEKEEKRNEGWVLCEENPGGLILKRPP